METVDKWKLFLLEMVYTASFGEDVKPLALGNRLVCGAHGYSDR